MTTVVTKEFAEKEFLRRQARMHELVKDVNTDIFLQIDTNKALEMFLADDNLNAIDDVSVELSTGALLIIKITDKVSDAQCQVELCWVNAVWIGGRCNCEKGRKHIRCEHLARAFQAYTILLERSLVKKLTTIVWYICLPYALT